MGKPDQPVCRVIQGPGYKVKPGSAAPRGRQGRAYPASLAFRGSLVREVGTRVSQEWLAFRVKPGPTAHKAIPVSESKA